MSRVAQFGVLSPLTIDDATAMVEHRWKTAGGEIPLPIEKDAFSLIYEAAKGLPRDIVKVCNSTLTHAYARRLKSASLESAHYAIDEHHLAKEQDHVE